MKTYFDNLQPLKVSEFFRKFDMHINKRDKVDKNEKDTFQILKRNSSSLSFYLGILNEMGVENLILPQHDKPLEHGRDPDRPVKVGGERFHKIIKDYRDKYIPNSRFPKCVKKIRDQQSRFFNNNNNPLLKADFLFVCNHKDFAHPNEGGGHYDTTHGGNKIYMGNGFHRFVAYGLWNDKNGFKPLELYYVHHTDV